MRRILRENKGTMKPGQDLVIAGYAGRAGARIIAIERADELLTRFSGDYIENIQENKDVKLDGNLEQWRKFGAVECEPVGEGGVFTALWNLSGAYEAGIEFRLHRIPIKQSTIEVCECYDLNPYRLYSENCLLLVGDHGGHMVEALQAQGIPAAVIGRVNEGIKREIYSGRSEEGKAFLDRPKKDELKKIMNDQEA